MNGNECCIFCGELFDSSKWNRRKWEESDEDGCDCHCVECARANIEMGIFQDPRKARMEKQKMVNKIFRGFK